MRPDAILEPVIDGAELQGLLEGPEGLLHLEELPVAQGHVLGAQRVVRCPDEVLAVQMLLRLDLGPVDREPAFCVLLEAPPPGRMTAQRAHRLGVLTFRQVLEALQFLLQYLGVLFPTGPVPLGLLGVPDQDVALSGLPVPDDDLLDLQLVPYLLVAPLP